MLPYFGVGERAHSAGTIRLVIDSEEFGNEWYHGKELDLYFYILIRWSDQQSKAKNRPRVVLAEVHYLTNLVLDGWKKGGKR